MKYKNMGTAEYNNVITSKGRGAGGRPLSIKTKDFASNTGLAFIKGELEKIDPKLRQPLSVVTWSKHLPVKTGGGWVESLSAMGVGYSTQGGGMEASIINGNTNVIPVIQADTERDVYKTHVFSAIMRINYIDLQRSKITDRNLEQMAVDGIRLAYEKHMDHNAYLGFPKFNTTGLLNNPDITARPVKAGAKGSKKWVDKTPDEILHDINTAILKGWEQAEWDRSAIPNTILMPYEQLSHLANTRMSELAEKTILTYVKENNVAVNNGGVLDIDATTYCKGAGVGNEDRMVCYVNDDYFICVEELVGLHRALTEAKTDTLSYDTVYLSNISEVEIFYNQPISYYDGI